MMKAASFLVAFYVLVPLIIYLWPWTLAYAVFAHLLRVPYFIDLTRPEYVLNHTCNFYLEPEQGVRVGVWHTLPASHWDKAAGKGPEWYRRALGDGSPVIIYLHGNVGTRAKDHRVQLVKILSTAGFHILSLDYRGYGDSTGQPSERGMTTDALHLYTWVERQSGGSLVCLWGHSLGSGVASNTAVKVQEQGSVVDALILEAPFTSIGEVVVNFPVAKLYTFLPGFELFLWNTLETNKLLFSNEDKCTRPSAQFKGADVSSAHTARGGRRRGAVSHGSEAVPDISAHAQGAEQRRSAGNNFLPGESRIVPQRHLLGSWPVRVGGGFSAQAARITLLLELTPHPFAANQYLCFFKKKEAFWVLFITHKDATSWRQSTGY
ncbi:lysophosphatidylserine lipase ABHD12-like isoform X1 [Phycodurus eques]|uniref:lysophosphatidylserine lipase ABHD12-like isoform X1 n=1 Tax=Phycodurus eques TaxID=693459 RepID=UPI002ACDE694|nr:lysophosphatidylserine lipase ABHD12-like isoform X1 [Phycodurus eques]